MEDVLDPLYGRLLAASELFGSADAGAGGSTVVVTWTSLS